MTARSRTTLEPHFPEPQRNDAFTKEPVLPGSAIHSADSYTESVTVVI